MYSEEFFKNVKVDPEDVRVFRQTLHRKFVEFVNEIEHPAQEVRVVDVIKWLRTVIESISIVAAMNTLTMVRSVQKDVACQLETNREYNEKQRTDVDRLFKSMLQVAATVFVKNLGFTDADVRKIALVMQQSKKSNIKKE